MIEKWTGYVNKIPVISFIHGYISYSCSCCIVSCWWWFTYKFVIFVLLHFSLYYGLLDVRYDEVFISSASIYLPPLLPESMNPPPNIHSALMDLPKQSHLTSRADIPPHSTWQACRSTFTLMTKSIKRMWQSLQTGYGGVGGRELVCFPLSVTSLDRCHFQYCTSPLSPADRQVPISFAFSPPFPAQVSKVQTGDSGGSWRSVAND